MQSNIFFLHEDLCQERFDSAIETNNEACIIMNGNQEFLYGIRSESQLTIFLYGISSESQLTIF